MIEIENIVASTFVRDGEWHDEIGSTNDRALILAADPLIKLPYLIGTNRQVAGRGRGTNRWWSGEGPIVFSVLLEMSQLGLNQIRWPLFSLVTGLSVAETLETFLPYSSIGIKWPNDVCLAGRKVCGILIEQPERPQGRLVAGLGWNANTSFATAPEEISAIAISMREESGQTYIEEDLVRCFLQRWEFNLATLAAGSFDLVSRWSRLCSLRDRRIRIVTEDGTMTGICRGIADDGALLIEDAGGPHRHYAGTVRIVE